MSSFICENNCSKYFTTVQELESQCEELRQALCSVPEFIPEVTFNLIDIDTKNFLSLNDLKAFLREQNFGYSEENLRKFVHNYDRDGDFAINFNEFLNMVLPRKNPEMKSSTLNRNPNDNSQLTPQVQNALVNLIAKELQLVEDLASIATDLKNSKDFTIYEAFVNIVNSEEKYITPSIMEAYMKKQGVNLGENEIEDIIFRLDSDGDGKISYDEFQEIFFPFKVGTNNTYQENNSPSFKYSSSSIDHQNKIFGKETKREEMLKDEFEETNLSRNENFMKSTYPGKFPLNWKESEGKIMSTPDKFYSSVSSMKRVSPIAPQFKASRNDDINMRASMHTYTSPKKIECDSFSPLRSYNSRFNDSCSSSVANFMHTRRFGSPDRRFSPKRCLIPYQPRVNYSLSSEKRIISREKDHSLRILREKKTNLVRFLNELATEDSQTEKIKETFSMQTDINLSDLFIIFDYSGRNSISLIDLQEVMRDAEIFPTLEALKLVFKKYDTDKDGRLDFNEFCEMICPKKEEYARILKRRTPGEYFVELSNESKDILEKLLLRICDSEAIIEKRRRLFTSYPGFSAYECFEMMKDKYRFVIFKDDISRFTQDNGCCLSTFEIELLMERFDKNRDGKVTFNEFLQELMPK